MTAVQKQQCLESDIYPVEYSPEGVLDSFFARLRSQAGFIFSKPADHGLWAIHLLNRLLYTMSEAKDKKTTLGRNQPFGKHNWELPKIC